MLNSLKLRQVIAVDQAGSISGAAANLNITQSTVTKVVADVEQDLGYALFVRKSRGVVTTEQGRDFLNRAARIIADLDILIEDARDQKQEGESVLRLGISPAYLEGLLNRTVEKIVLDSPEQCLNMVAAPLERGIQLLKRGDIDLLLGPAGDLEAESEFVTEMIAQIEPVLFCRKGHPLLAVKKLGIQDLLEYRFIAPNPVSSYSEGMWEKVAAAGKDPKRMFHIIENFSIVTELVLKTDLIAFVTKSYTKTAKFRKHYSTLMLDIFEPVPVAVAYRRKWLPGRGMRICLSALRQYPPG